MPANRRGKNLRLNITYHTVWGVSINNMRTFFLWVIIAFLFGIAGFGLFESIKLIKQNGELKEESDQLTLELVTTKNTLDQTRQSLAESKAWNSELTSEMTVLKAKLAKREEENQEIVARLTALSKEIKEVGDANASLAIDQDQLKSEYLRLEFENSEMKQKLSSLQGLKQAIKELKLKAKKGPIHKKQPQAVVVKKPLAVTGIQRARDLQPSEQPLGGNKGYLIKDGRPTFEGIVDIRVVPAE